MKPKIYTDTSVIGGCLDIEFKEGSQALFERFKSNSAILMISSLTLLELEKAPQDVQNVLKQVPIENMEYIELSIEAKQLADKYLSEGVVSKKSKVDAQHIAIATVNRADVLVSWNFKHIVNLDRIHGYNAVNLKQGYPMIEIRTPLEVLNYEN
jgi:predicted nucleic acid-binding protein